MTDLPRGDLRKTERSVHNAGYVRIYRAGGREYVTVTDAALITALTLSGLRYNVNVGKLATCLGLDPESKRQVQIVAIEDLGAL